MYDSAINDTMIISLCHYRPADEDDPPVQGPLPYEPDDAPWKKSTESGVRKLWVFSFKITHPKWSSVIIKFRTFCFLTVFVNYLLSQALQASHAVRYPHSLKWLYLLVLVAALPFEPNTSRTNQITAESTTPAAISNNILERYLSHHSNNVINGIDIWFIKWKWVDNRKMEPIGKWLASFLQKYSFEYAVS